MFENYKKRAGRALFRRSQKEYTVVRLIRLTRDEVLQPGTHLKIGDYRFFRIQSWYQRRLIGVKGSDWAEHMLERFLDDIQEEAEEVVDTPDPPKDDGTIEPRPVPEEFDPFDDGREEGDDE